MNIYKSYGPYNQYEPYEDVIYRLTAFHVSNELREIKKRQLKLPPQDQSFLGLKVAQTVSVLEVAKLGPTAILEATQ